MLARAQAVIVALKQAGRLGPVAVFALAAAERVSLEQAAAAVLHQFDVPARHGQRDDLVGRRQAGPDIVFGVHAQAIDVAQVGAGLGVLVEARDAAQDRTEALAVRPRRPLRG